MTKTTVSFSTHARFCSNVHNDSQLRFYKHTMRLVRDDAKLRNSPLIPAIARMLATTLNHSRKLLCMNAIRGKSFLSFNCLSRLSASASQSNSSLWRYATTLTGSD